MMCSKAVLSASLVVGASAVPQDTQSVQDSLVLLQHYAGAPLDAEDSPEATEGLSLLQQGKATWDIKSWFGWSKTATAKTDTEESADKEQIANKRNQTNAKNKGNQSSGTKTCAHWCSDSMFTNEEGNETVLRRPSWDLKCTWASCNGCGHCGEESASALEQTTNATEEVTKADDGQGVECKDWCTEEEFRHMTENGSEMRTFHWEQKCKWTHCGACGNCTDGATQVSLGQGSADVSSGLGDTVPVTEKGYKDIAALANDQDMKAFIRRVVAAEARFIKDEGALNGMVPFYSGTQAVQSLQALQRELRTVPWVLDAEGRKAPLNEFGYAKVAKMMSQNNMVAFARRVLDGESRKVADEAAMLETVSHFNGETGRGWEDFKHTLLCAEWAVHRSDGAPVPCKAAEADAAKTATEDAAAAKKAQKAAEEAAKTAAEEDAADEEEDP